MREYAPTVPKRRALDAVDVSPATFYRRSNPDKGELPDRPQRKVRPPREPLSEDERNRVLEVLCSEEFVDKSVREVYAHSLDKGEYLCSVSTMYRILNAQSCVKERRKIARRAHYTAPELIATSPNEVWSWDITKLKGAQKWTYYYLYVMMDIYSRYVVGWMVASRENAALARVFIRDTTERHGIEEGSLTIHSDRGSPMTAKTTSQLHADLGILQSLSRPQVSNDNPFSESTFKTLKYSAGFPDRFPNIQTAREFCHGFFSWYNDEHMHSGLALFTPEMVHFGRVSEVAKHRQMVLNDAFSKNPSRFSRAPRVATPPDAVFINPPVPNQACALLSASADLSSASAQARGVSQASKLGEGRRQPLPKGSPAVDGLT